MNILFFLIPKEKVAYIDSDSTVRQALEKMKIHRYTTIPILKQDGKYHGTLSEGDLLYHIHDHRLSFEALEMINLSKVKKDRYYQSVRIDANIEDLIEIATQQNFIPITDDFNHFIGIVTRKDIILHMKKSIQK